MGWRLLAMTRVVGGWWLVVGGCWLRVAGSQNSAAGEGFASSHFVLLAMTGVRWKGGARCRGGVLKGALLFRGLLRRLAPPRNDGCTLERWSTLPWRDLKGTLLFKWGLSLVVRVAGMGINGGKGCLAERKGKGRK